MIYSIRPSIAVFMRVCLFVALFAGPLGAMTWQQERGLGYDSNAFGLVLLQSLQRG